MEPGAPVQSSVPAKAGTRPATRRSRLDLPLPFGPVSTNASPASSRKDRPAKTSRPPRRQARQLAFSSVADIVKPASNRQLHGRIERAVSEAEATIGQRMAPDQSPGRRSA